MKKMTLILTLGLILVFQSNIFARGFDSDKVVKSFYSWYLKNKDHNPKKLKKFLSAKLYQEVQQMENESMNEYFTRKPKDKSLTEFSKYEIDNNDFYQKEKDSMYVHLWDKKAYFSRMTVTAIFEDGKWKIDKVFGITNQEAIEKEILGEVETPELKKHLIKLEEPTFPPAAKAVRVYGEVKLEIIVDEDGKVVSAKTVLGHPLLRTASEKAALKSAFSSIIVDGKPVKATGIIVYTFNPYDELYPNFLNTCG